MSKLAILCHPCTPVPESDIEEWLEDRLGQIRGLAPEALIRLSRLTQELPSSEIGLGWLIELELSGESLLLEHGGLADALADLVTDLRFLGLQPLVLTPLDLSLTPQELNGPGGSASNSGPVLDYPGLE